MSVSPMNSIGPCVPSVPCFHSSTLNSGWLSSSSQDVSGRSDEHFVASNSDKTHADSLAVEKICIVPSHDLWQVDNIMPEYLHFKSQLPALLMQFNT